MEAREWLGKKYERIRGMLVHDSGGLDEESFQEACVAVLEKGRGTPGDFEETMKREYGRSLRAAYFEGVYRIGYEEALGGDSVTSSLRPQHSVESGDASPFFGKEVESWVNVKFSRDEVAVWKLRLRGFGVRVTARSFGMTERRVKEIENRIKRMAAARFAAGKEENNGTEDLCKRECPRPGKEKIQKRDGRVKKVKPVLRVCFRSRRTKAGAGEAGACGT